MQLVHIPVDQISPKTIQGHTLYGQGSAGGEGVNITGAGGGLGEKVGPTFFVKLTQTCDVADTNSKS